MNLICSNLSDSDDFVCDLVCGANEMCTPFGQNTLDSGIPHICSTVTLLLVTCPTGPSSLPAVVVDLK